MVSINEKRPLSRKGFAPCERKPRFSRTSEFQDSRQIISSQAPFSRAID
nr:MAG TPA: hypothetical protein [Caudoviricetes sp.]